MANTHLKFGGSTAHRWLRCPGSVKLCASIPEQPANPSMQAGTHAHMLLEHCINNLITDCSTFKGKQLDIAYRPFEPSDTDAVQVALDYVWLLLALDPQAKLNTEVQVKLNDRVGGTADIIVYVPTTEQLHVIDYKHGVRSVQVDNNDQLRLYASAALASGLIDDLVSVVSTTIIQPRSYGDDNIRSAHYDPQELTAYIGEVRGAVELAEAENPPFVPGGVQCRWCPASHVCPALREQAEEALSETLWAEQLRNAERTVVLPDAADCRDASVLAKALRATEMLELWIAEVKEAAMSCAKSGASLPGYKLIEKRPARKWTSEADIKQWFDSSPLTIDDYAPRELISVAQAEKLVKAKLGKGEVNALAEYVTKESSGLNLVREGAKGEPVNPLQLLATDFSSAITI